MSKGSIAIYTSAAGQAAPLPGAALTVLDENGAVVTRLTADADGFAEVTDLPAPEAAYSLDAGNTAVRPYALYGVRAVLNGWQTLVLDGVQVFDGQQTVARMELLPSGVVSAAGRSGAETVTIPPHALFTGGGGSGPAPQEVLPGNVLTRVVIPKKITVHLGKPSANVSNVTVGFQSYIANVASSEVYPTWVAETSHRFFCRARSAVRRCTRAKVSRSMMPSWVFGTTIHSPRGRDTVLADL